MEANLYHKFKGQDLNKDLDLEQKIQQISAFVKQSLLSKNIAIFIGSGCSVPEIPLMSITMREILKDEEILNIVKRFLGGEKINLFLSFLKDKLDKENKEITELFSQLKNEQYTLINEIPIQYAKYLEEFYTNYSDIESLLNWLQNGITFNPNDKDLVEAFNKIKSKFIATIPTQQSQKYNSEVFKIYTQFYDSIFKSRSIESPKVSIFTTNYDLFNEKALEANNIIYTTGFTSGLTKKFDINQFKYRKVDDTDRYKDRWQPVSHEANLYKIHVRGRIISS